MTDKKQRLAEIEERVSKATPGPWVAQKIFGRTTILGKAQDFICRFLDDCITSEDQANIALISNARQDVPWLIAELNAAWAREEWQPIEKAPEHEDIYIFCENGNFIAHKRDWEAVSGWFVRGWDEPYEGYEQAFIKPTHWRPLPEPPALNQQEGGSDE